MQELLMQELLMQELLHAGAAARRSCCTQELLFQGAAAAGTRPQQRGGREEEGRAKRSLRFLGPLLYKSCPLEGQRTRPQQRVFTWAPILAP